MGRDMEMGGEDLLDSVMGFRERRLETKKWLSSTSRSSMEAAYEVLVVFAAYRYGVVSTGIPLLV